MILSGAFYAKRYIRGVADFIAVGRVAGRYVMSVTDMEAGLGLITLAAMVEAKYQTGFALAFWETIYMPVGVFMALMGYCTYRFRATRALSAGQFLEMRYNRAFRIIASALRTLAEMLGNSIGPAVAANFFIYFLGLPHKILIGSIAIPTFAVTMAILLSMAICIMWTGGRLSLLITDCLQGIIAYPIFVILAGYVLLNFSWSEEIIPVMTDRVAGESFINPLDISSLRDFNIFAIVVVLFSRVINRASWIGGETTSCGKTPHEQKMAGILSTWRGGMSIVMCIVITIAIIIVMNHANHATKARQIRVELADRVAEQIITNPQQKSRLLTEIAAIPEQHHRIGVDEPLSQKQNLDTTYLRTAHDVIGYDNEGNAKFQEFRTLYRQVMLSVSARHIFPVGIIGLFSLLMVMLMLTTDDTRIFNSSTAIIQDVVMPLRKTPLTPQQHILWLKVSSVLVALFFFFASLFFAQLDYIMMFITIMGGIWCGGAGPVMVFGLYTRWGTTSGAFAAIIAGSGTSIGGMLLQRNWAETIYPLLSKNGWSKNVDSFLQSVSAPFAPYIAWSVHPVKCPFNSYEILFMAMIFGIGAYVVVSLITYRQPFNLDRMLHRGKYDINNEHASKPQFNLKHIFTTLIGITPEYTRGDKIIAWATFIYSFGYSFLGCFIMIMIWNAVTPWHIGMWSTYFYITVLCVPVVIGIISTFWFLIGGIIDIRRLFRDLAKRVDNPLDDGRVSGHVSLMEVGVLGEDEEENLEHSTGNRNE